MLFGGDGHVNAGDTANFGYFDKFSVSLWVQADHPTGTLVSRMTPVDEGAGWALHLDNGRLQFNLVKRWLDDAIRVETRDPLPSGKWCHVAATYDGSRVAGGIRLWVDGRPAPLNTKLDRLNQTFAVATEPLRIGGGAAPFRGAIDEVRLFQRDLTGDEVRVLSVSQSVAEILGIPSVHRTGNQQDKLRRFHLAHHAPPEIRAAHAERFRLQRERRAFHESLPTVMVMQEMPEPRATHVLVRGQYDNPGARVFPSVPAIFPPWRPTRPEIGSASPVGWSSPTTL